jgi:hypothetical protein
MYNYKKLSDVERVLQERIYVLVETEKIVALSYCNVVSNYCSHVAAYLFFYPVISVQSCQEIPGLYSLKLSLPVSVLTL